uniref:Uncharacterized protein n=1 Tax=Oryza meridionalis TaxID=40149 RepID=A0A0E0EK08_9ORYZ
MDSMNATQAKGGNMMKQEGHTLPMATPCACAMATDSAHLGKHVWALRRLHCLASPATHLTPEAYTMILRGYNKTLQNDAQM